MKRIFASLALLVIILLLTFSFWKHEDTRKLETETMETPNVITKTTESPKENNELESDKKENVVTYSVLNNNSVAQCTEETKEKKKKEIKKKKPEKSKNIEEKIQKELDKINLISDKKKWFIERKKLIKKYSDVYDPPETIYNFYSKEELNLLFSVVQAEIGDYSFEQRCNVASVIFNRIEHEEFPNSMFGVLTADQFATISNGRIYNVTVDNTTKLACEYVFEFGDTTGGALFFDSNGVLNYRFLYNDGAHNFYTLSR